MKKKIFLLFLTLLSSLFFFDPNQTFANENFYKTLNSTYTVNDLGSAHIEHVITLKNLTPAFYIKQYAIKVSSTNLSEVKVKIDDQEITANVVEEERETSIAVVFPDKTVGQDKTRTLVITYDNPDSAVVTGNTLAVYVPRLANKQDYQEYSLTIYSPQKYGYPTRTFPGPHFSSQMGDKIITKFDQIDGEGISALFGSTQIFDLTLRYNLENQTSNTGLMQIALPPDTVYQKMAYLDIQPPPKEIQTDIDGNWIATYQVEAETNTIIYVTAKAKISLIPNLEYVIPKPTKVHLNSQPYWEVEDQEIKKIALENPSSQQIYDYVVNSLNYNPLVDLKRERLGAKKALSDSQNAVCQEFSDLFVAICRAAGIPSRRVSGFAYSENSSLRPLSLVEDILHTWPEYYNRDQKFWVPVDPTWGNTTGGIDYFNQFDLNHVVFSINGLSSEVPFSAGSFKLTNQNTKDVEVKFSDQFPEIEPKYHFDINQKKLWIFPIPGFYELKITNETGQAYYNINLQIESENASVFFDNRPLSTILPMQTIVVPLYLSSKYTLPRQEIIKFHLSNETKQFTLTSGVNLDFIFKYSPIAIGLAAGVIITSLVTGSILVYRYKRSNSIRR